MSSLLGVGSVSGNGSRSGAMVVLELPGGADVVVGFASVEQAVDEASDTTYDGEDA